MFNHSKAIIDQFGGKVVTRAKKNLNTTGFSKKGRKINASGNLSKSLYYEIIEEEGRLIIDFKSSEKYASFVEEGRRKGKMPPINAILKWLEEKKVRLREVKVNKNGQKVSRFVTNRGQTNMYKAAFAIARAIGKRGIPATNFYSEAMDYEFDSLPPEIAEAITQDLADFLYEDFKKKGINVSYGSSS